jgi:hypothetical protein
MKAPAHLFASPRPVFAVARLAAGVGACLLTSACVGNVLSDATIDPSSPIAPEAAKLTNTKAPFPKFTQIPAVPKDVRPVKQFGVAAAETVSVRDDLVAKTDPNTWTLKEGDTATFAGQGRTAAGPEIAPGDTTATEAFAAELRKRATPPPPPKR